jgi:hypothetical protein
LGCLALTITFVSTVLRPVGPHEARVYWFRRAVVVAVIAAIVIVLVLVFSGGSGKPAAKTPRPTPSTTSTPTTPVITPTALAACDPTAIKLVLSTDSDSYTSGQTAKLVGAFRNSAATACTLSRDPAGEVWTITSGTDTIWSTKGCASNSTAKQVTIKAGATKLVSIFWDGDRRDSACAVGAVAQPGEYVLSATLDGVKGQPAIFHVTS